MDIDIHISIFPHTEEIIISGLVLIFPFQIQAVGFFSWDSLILCKEGSVREAGKLFHQASSI